MITKNIIYSYFIHVCVYDVHDGTIDIFTLTNFNILILTELRII